MSMVKCPFCSKQTDNANKLCMYCGTLLPVDTVNNSANQLPQHTSPRDSSPQITQSTVNKRQMPPPIAPHKQGVFILFLISTIIFSILTIICPFIATEEDNIAVGIIFYLALAVTSAYISYKTYSSQKKDFELYKKDANKYFEKQEQIKKRNQERMRQQQIAEVNKRATCPYCQSKNTKRISTTSRVASVAMTGIASKKIGKQWHCNHCGSDF